MIQIERRFGKGSIIQLGTKAVVDVPVIPTGSLALDKALKNNDRLNERPS
jgi:recombination protein RecA